MTIKTHQAVKGTVADPDAMRSLCGRSSGRVWNVETIESGQNLGAAVEVDCKFCLALNRNFAANKR
jgi:hypothetical protein